jgi:hypothetical protein
VLEADLGDVPPEDWIARARDRGAELLWLHAQADLSAYGFECFPGYVRLRAESPPHGQELPRLEPEHFAATQDAAFRGLWGHKVAIRSGCARSSRLSGWSTAQASWRVRVIPRSTNGSYSVPAPSSGLA